MSQAALLATGGRRLCLLVHTVGPTRQVSRTWRRHHASTATATRTVPTNTPSIAVPNKKITTPVVVIALSGGVDSSVAAALLLQQQDEHKSALTALHMTNWNAQDDDTLDSACSAKQDLRDAEKVAQRLGLPLHSCSLESDYWNSVFAPFLDQLLTGSMGNPDVDCNTHVKFGALHEYLQRWYPDTPSLAATAHSTSTTRTSGGYRLATGHYARLWHRSEHQQPPLCVQAGLEADSDRGWTTGDWLATWGNNMAYPLLLAARDKTKDQSYFLSGCSSESLQNVIFPLGDLIKNQNSANDNIDNDTDSSNWTVREWAQHFDLPTAGKRESMGICFIGKRKNGFRDFVQHYLPPPTQCLEFVDVETGRTMATTRTPVHPVLLNPGQGAKVGGTTTKYFIVDRENETNIRICPGTHHPALYADSLWIQGNLHWMVGMAPPPLLQEQSLRVQCRIRHLQPLVDATVVVHGERTEIHFDKPVRGITAGQRAVLYLADGAVCLGGGVIGGRGPSYWERGLPLPATRHAAGHNDFS